LSHFLKRYATDEWHLKLKIYYNQLMVAHILLFQHILFAFPHKNAILHIVLDLYWRDEFCESVWVDVKFSVDLMKWKMNKNNKKTSYWCIENLQTLNKYQQVLLEVNTFFQLSIWSKFQCFHKYDICLFLQMTCYHSRN